MEMETYSKNTWTSNGGIRHEKFAGPLTHKCHSDDREEILDIDTDVDRCRKAERGLPKQDDFSQLNDVKARLGHEASCPPSGQQLVFRSVGDAEESRTDNDAASCGETDMAPRQNNEPEGQRTLLPDAGADSIEISEEEEEEIDDDDDDDEGEERLVVNIESEDAPDFTQSNLEPFLAAPKVSLSCSSPAPASEPSSPCPAKMTKPPPETPPEPAAPPRHAPTAIPEPKSPQKSSTAKGKSSCARSLPIHCIIEHGDDGEDLSSAHCQPLMDSYAILPGSTLFREIVSSSLSKLGYSTLEAVGAKGCLQLKNWKTLNFSAITDNQEANVEEILGEITSVATLKIRLSNLSVRSNVSANTSDDVKEKLLQLLLTKSKDYLLQAGCPIDKHLLDSILMGEASQKISDQLCTSFNDWLLDQKEHNSRSSQSESTKQSSLLAPPPATSLSPMNKKICPATTTEQGSLLLKTGRAMARVPPLPEMPPLTLDIKETDQVLIKTEIMSDFPKECSELSIHHGQPNHRRGDSVSPQDQKHHLDRVMEKSAPRNNDLYKMSRSPSEGHLPSTLHHHPSNPYLGLMPGKTRIRTSFDPEHEIPRLQKWFNDNQHPTREQMMRFMQELNGLESRKGRRPLDLTNIIYWFKNARAAQRRASKALDDSFENEENVDMTSSNSVADCMPPYLPNKNAVYMIPFHPYPHLLTDSGGDNSSISGAGIDEPYDLSVTKRPSDLTKTPNDRDKSDKPNLCASVSPSTTKSSPASSEGEGYLENPRKRKPSSMPRFPALLDVASKMRQEIPERSNGIYHSNKFCNKNGDRGSPPPGRSGSGDQEMSNNPTDIENGFTSPAKPLLNGITDHFLSSLKIKHENGEYLARENHSGTKEDYHHTTRGLELGQVKKEQDNNSFSDDDNTNDSYNSEEELKFRMKQNAAVVDYASAIHNNVSRLTAANMAALSLAQMGQSLHIPQLPPSLAMAYYPMNPRFYTQTSMQHSLSSSPPSSLASNHSSHLAQLSIRQGQDMSAPHNMDNNSPLPSPSSLQQTMNKLNHHGQHHQRQSPQEHHHHHRLHHSSEPRKRRTRVFIDPLTEIPKLEKWFTEDTHPSAFMIDKYCEELNKCEYRHKFPKLEPKNVQLWFKNHRAKVKRMKVSIDGLGDPDCNIGPDDDMDD